MCKLERAELVSCVCPYEARSRASNSQVSMRVRPEKKLEKEGRENLDFLCGFGKKKEANTIYYKWLFGKKHTLFTVSS